MAITGFWIFFGVGDNGGYNSMTQNCGEEVLFFPLCHKFQQGVDGELLF